mgnify:CR=1 FL=1|jgi:hypothetical protein|tara:strand:+ start:180 stop:341 length:162 start_codon:yes stop_codon:yes gene_type:complete
MRMVWLLLSAICMWSGINIIINTESDAGIVFGAIGLLIGAYMVYLGAKDDTAN